MKFMKNEYFWPYSTKYRIRRSTPEIAYAAEKGRGVFHGRDKLLPLMKKYNMFKHLPRDGVFTDEIFSLIAEEEDTTKPKRALLLSKPNERQHDF